jgi:hypothetical protein
MSEGAARSAANPDILSDAPPLEMRRKNGAKQASDL